MRGCLLKHRTFQDVPAVVALRGCVETLSFSTNEVYHLYSRDRAVHRVFPRGWPVDFTCVHVRHMCPQELGCWATYVADIRSGDAALPEVRPAVQPHFYATRL